MTQTLHCITGYRWSHVWFSSNHAFSFPLKVLRVVLSLIMTGRLFQLCPPFMDKTFWPKVVLLCVISQSPLVPDLVPCPVSLFLWMNSLTGAGAGPCKHLYIKQAFLNTFKFPKSRNLCFSRTLQWWWEFGFRSNIFTALLYICSKGFKVEVLANAQFVKQ